MAQPTRNAMDKPMSVEQIVAGAGSSFDTEYSMRNWFRTAELMLKQANIYEHEGNEQMAYLLLYRHARLILSELGTHPDAKDAEYRKAWVDARKSLSRTMAKLEVLKPRINKKYEKYQEMLRARAAHQLPASQQGNAQKMDNQSAVRHSSPARINAHDNSDLAVSMANREIQRRRDPQAQLRSPSHKHQHDQAHGINTRMVEARQQIDRSAGHIDVPTRRSSSNKYTYPSIPSKSRTEADRTSYEEPMYSPPISLPGGHQTQGLQPPDLPPKYAVHETVSNISAPPLPQKVVHDSSLHESTSLTNVSATSPTHQFSASSHLENGEPLRTIFLPSPLRHSFLKLASPNTSRNLETCGILCGTLIQNAFFITHLVVPAQTSTPDTCEMLDEAALYSFIDSQPGELMVLGWIHTHPTQTCFMSSRDLHTHCWYQLQLAESIAIVCSPSKDPDWGVFRLTDPPGMGSVRACKQTGIFHPHSETHLFTDALGRPGHVVEHEDLAFDVVDLRGKS